MNTRGQAHQVFAGRRQANASFAGFAEPAKLEGIVVYVVLVHRIRRIQLQDLLRDDAQSS